MKKQGVLLMNLGSPDSPSVADVRRYLRQFLMDGRVLDAPWPIRFFIVNGLILPRRPKESAEAYRSIWQKEGSPLIVSSRRLQTEMAKRLEIPVELAMRYRNPSIESAVERLRVEGVEQLVVAPLFPHYAMSSYESAAERAREVLGKKAPGIEAVYLPPFYDHPEYIESLVESSREHLAGGFDHLLFSFHGLPERHLHKSDPTGSHCLSRADCCLGDHPAHRTCYRAQCFKTVAAFVEKAGIPREKYSVAFQSRLGRDPWMQPYTDQVVKAMPGKGIERLTVLSPAFVSDCLETLEELGIRAREDFLSAGGKELVLVPCLNDHPRWLDGLAAMLCEQRNSFGIHERS